MGKKHKPRSGSIAFYPRKRAKRELATFTTFAKTEEKTAKPMNFVGFKVGMVQLAGKNEHPKSVTVGQEIVVPATILEVPPVKIFGIRAYTKNARHLEALSDVLADKPDKFLRKKIATFKQTHSKKKKDREPKNTVEWLDSHKEEITDIRLLAQTQPSMTVIGRKRPDLFEIFLSGTVEQKMAFAKEKLGKEVLAGDLFKEKDFVDVRAVDTGKGFVGVIKRFGVKHHRPKAKKHRVVGSIGPWNPSTVMWTVARAGQMGYQTRTELNKRVLMLGNDSHKLSADGTFKHYGPVKNNFLLISGSLPGPPKRAISLRHGLRKNRDMYNLSGIVVIGASQKAKKAVGEVDDFKATKVLMQKEEKKEHKSVEEEIAAATAGQKAK